MQNISKIYIVNILVITMLLLGFMSAAAVFAPNTSAQGVKSNICEGANLSLSEGDGNSCAKDNACTARNSDNVCIQRASDQKLNNLITSIVNILSVIIGIIAVIMIIIGGAKFITSGGDSGKVSSAKTTVIYALVGLIIVALAQFIVRFVLSKT